MAKFIQITPSFAIAAQLGPEDFARAAEAGFRTIVNNRPDGEERNQLSAAEGQALAQSHGLNYEHIPATKHDLLTDPVIGRTGDVISAADGPILAHCKSGQRSAIVWAAATARTNPVAEILAALRDAGLDLAFLRDELDKQADRARWSAEPHPAPAQEPSAQAVRNAAQAA